jgi:hypothetical protein
MLLFDFPACEPYRVRVMSVRRRKKRLPKTAVVKAPRRLASSYGHRVALVKHAQGRSAVTNGNRLHVERPGDTKWARRFADVLHEIVSDLMGQDGLSEGQRQLARRATTLSIACEKMEGEAARGAEIDLDMYGTMTDRLGRVFQRLGLERRSKDVTPDLQTYIRKTYGANGNGKQSEAER